MDLYLLLQFQTSPAVDGPEGESPTLSAFSQAYRRCQIIWPLLRAESRHRYSDCHVFPGIPRQAARALRSSQINAVSGTASWWRWRTGSPVFRCPRRPSFHLLVRQPPDNRDFSLAVILMTLFRGFAHDDHPVEDFIGVMFYPASVSGNTEMNWLADADDMWFMSRK